MQRMGGNRTIGNVHNQQCSQPSKKVAAKRYSVKGMTMPRVWSNKDDRQYKHIKNSEQEQGRSEDRAEEIAAATVNKQRHKEGRTKEQREQHRD